MTRRADISVFLSGRILSLIVLLGFQIMVVRILVPREYGTFALVFAWAVVTQAVLSFGVPRLIPKYLGQAGHGLASSAARKLVFAMLTVRVIGSLVAVPAAIALARALHWASPTEPGLLVAATLYIAVSVAQVDGDAMAQALGLQSTSRIALLGEAVIRFGAVAAAARSGHAMSAAAVLTIASLTAAMSAMVLFTAVLNALRLIPAQADQRAIDRRELRALALGGHVSTMAWFASSPGVVRLIANRTLGVLAFASFSFMQTLVVSFQRYTPAMLLFPFVEPQVMRDHARTGDLRRLEAALSLLTKLDIILVGGAIVGAVVAGGPLVGLMTGGRYGDFAYALPWLLAYVVSASVYRSFEIVAVALDASAALVWTIVPSLFWVGAALLLAPRFGLPALLVCPLADAVSRLMLVRWSLGQRGVRQVFDTPMAAWVVGIAAAAAIAGRGAAMLTASGSSATIAIGTGAGLAYLAVLAIIRPLRSNERELLPRQGRVAVVFDHLARS